jgi:hypothetical protein
VRAKPPVHEPAPGSVRRHRDVKKHIRLRNADYGTGEGQRYISELLKWRTWLPLGRGGSIGEKRRLGPAVGVISMARSPSGRCGLQSPTGC